MGSHPLTGPFLELREVDCRPRGAVETLLRGVSLSLDAGEIGVLLGGNGAGKSTLLRAIAGLLPVDAGEVRISGRERSPGFDSRTCALVLEDPSAQFVSQSVREELEFAAESGGGETARIRARVDTALERARLEHLAGRDPNSLSAGEQQRVLLAAALVPAPPLLILDDAFLYLDPVSVDETWEWMRSLVTEGEVTAALVASHDGELATRANRVGILDRGHMIAWGPADEVLRGTLPDEIEPPLGSLLERQLAEVGFPLPPGGLEVSALIDRVVAGISR